MPWGEGPGHLPPMRRTSGQNLVALLVDAHVLMLVGVDDLERPATSAAWHDLADLLGDAPRALADLCPEQRQALVRSLDGAIAALHAHRFRVIAGAAGGVVVVAVVPVGDRRDLRALFASA